MSRYNWSDYPDWVQWLAQDYDGELVGFDHKPQQARPPNKHWHGAAIDGRQESMGFPHLPPCLWPESLEQRPPTVSGASWLWDEAGYYVEARTGVELSRIQLAVMKRFEVALQPIETLQNRLIEAVENEQS